MTAVVLGACSDDGGTAAAPSTSSVATTTTAATTTTGPPTTVATTTSARAPSTTVPAASTTTSATASTTTSPPPPAVTEVRAGPGGGSGEVTVTWRGVAGATTYRVERADAPTGPFETSGVISTDGRTTKGAGVVNLYASADGTFTYVETIGGLSNGGVQRWYRVLALGAGGPSAPSRVVCGAPPGAPAC